MERQGTYETLAKSGFHFSLENKSEEPDEFDDTEDKSHTKVGFKVVIRFANTSHVQRFGTQDYNKVFFLDCSRAHT